MVRAFCHCSIALFFFAMAIPLTWAQPKAASEQDKVPLYSLAGAGGLPTYLKADARMLATADGLRGGECRTLVTDFSEKDFVLDLLFKFKNDEKSIALIGIGGTGRNALALNDCICSRVHGPGHGGYATLYISGKQESQLGKFITAGPHLFRLEKKGNVLTLSVGSWADGKFTPLASQSLPDLRAAAPFLRKPVASLFFAGDTDFQGVRLSVDGKAVDPGKAPPPPANLARVPMAKLGGQNRLPGYLRAFGSARSDKDGITGGLMRTAENGLIDKDFLLDVQFRFKDGDRAIMQIGIGGTKPGGIGWDESVCSRVHGPGHGGYATVFISGKDEQELGKFVTGGPHVFRLEKRGDTLTMAIGDMEKGAFEPYFQKTLPNLKMVAPFLTRVNSTIFLDASGGGGTLEAIRFVVNGKSPDPRVAQAEPKPATPSKTEPARPETPKTPGSGEATAKKDTKTPAAAAFGPAGKENLIRLTSGRLPTYLTSQREMAFDANGGLILSKRFYRSAKADFIKKDFTFDVVFRFRDNEQAIAVIGIGGAERDHNGAVLKDSVCSRVHGPGHGGYGTVTVHGQAERGLGKYVTAGPHLFRLQKRGNALTMAVCIDFKDKFVPDIEESIPDLKSAAPFLTDKNSWLFLGEGGIIDAVRLAVEGEPIETRDVVLDLPARIVEGKPLTRDLQKSAGTRRFSVDSAPQGLRITGSELTWTPTTAQLGKHPLRIRATSGKESLVVIKDIEVVSADDAKSVAGNLAKIDGLYKLPLASDKYQIVPGLDGKSLLLLDGDRLQRLVGNGVTVKETLKLPAKYERIGERADYFVGLSDEKKALHLIDKRTLTVKRSIQMDYFRRHDLALHPTRPTSYVCVDKGGDDVRDVILIFEENTGDVLEPPGFIGTWAVVSPDGNELYAGYKEIYRKGSRLLINPDRIHVLPEYGSYDLLLVYDITRPKPQRRRDKEEPGANGNGLALSPDGRRLSYLSFTGYPVFSKNIPAFDPANLEKRPVSYPCKDHGAGAQWIAFHPTLQLAAAPIEEGGAICFQRETGEALPDRVDVKYPPLG